MANKDPFGILERKDDFQTNDGGADGRELKLVGDVQQKFDESKRARSDKDKWWDYYRLMLQGESLIAKTRVDNEVLRVVLSGDASRSKSKDNILIEMHRAFIGKLTEVIPRVMVSPASDDRDDMLAAEVRTGFLDWQYEANKMELKFKRAVDTIDWAGIGIWHLEWDTFGGREISQCPQCEHTVVGEIKGPCPLCMTEAMSDEFDEEPLEVPQMERAFEGALKISVPSPFEFFPDPGCGLDIENAQHAFLVRVVPVNKLRERYPDKAHLIKPESELLEDKYISSLGGQKGRIEKKYYNDHVREFLYYEMPTGDYPKGRIIHMANDRILDEKENEIAHIIKRLPFFLARGDILGDDVWGHEIIGDSEGLQRERDIATSQLRRQRENASNPKLMTFRGSGVENKPITRNPEEPISVKSPALAPKYLRTPEMPQWASAEPERLKVAIRDKFAVTPHEVGQIQSGDSGRFAAMLENQTNGSIKGILLETHAEWQELHRAMIMVGKEMMPEDMVWVATGKDRPRIYAWKSANDTPGWDVFLAEEDSLSKNPQMRLQQALNLLQAGYFTDPQTGMPNWREFRRMARLQTAKIGPDADTAERIRAAQIPEQIKRALVDEGPMPTPQPWDDAMIRAEELLGWLRTAGQTEEPQVVQIVAQLWQTYVMSLMPAPGQMMDPMLMKLMPNQNLMQASQGAPQQAAGGPPATSMGAGRIPGTSPSPNSLIQQADQSAEAASRPQPNQEGSPV